MAAIGTIGCLPQRSLGGPLGTAPAHVTIRGQDVLLKRLRRNELVTTNTLEKAIAAPAMAGDSRPDIASGIANTL